MAGAAGPEEAANGVLQRFGFAAAERASGVPKSRLSRRVAALEADLGVRLLQRSTRRFAVTDVGQDDAGIHVRLAGGIQHVDAGSNNVMPAFGTNVNVMCYLDDIYVYLRARADGVLPRGRPASKSAQIRGTIGRPEASSSRASIALGTFMPPPSCGVRISSYTSSIASP